MRVVRRRICWSNPDVDGMVIDEVDNREGVIVDVVDLATSDLCADIRDAGRERIKSALGVVDA